MTSYHTGLTILKIVLLVRQKWKTLFMNGKIFIKSSKECWRLVIVFTYLFHIVCYFNVLSLDLCLLTIGEGIYVRRLLSWNIFRLTRQMPLVEQELLTPPEHLNLPPVFSGVHVTQSLILCECFVDRCFFFCPFSFWPLCCLFFFDILILITFFVCIYYKKNVTRLNIFNLYISVIFTANLNKCFYPMEYF